MVDKICYNGEIVSPDSLGEETWRRLKNLESHNYVYQNIHVHGQHAIGLGLHLQILARAISDIHGGRFDIPEGRIVDDIAALLRVNRFHNKSNSVMLKAFPNGEYIIEHLEQLLYEGFVVWHTRPMLDIFTGDYPFPGYPTDISLLVSKYADGVAGGTFRQDEEYLPVIENGGGIVTNVNNEPLFLVKGNTVAVTPLSGGGAETVMRKLISAACETARMEVTEYPLTRDMLKGCDEAFTASPQGLISFKGWENTRYFNIAVSKIVEPLAKIMR